MPTELSPEAKIKRFDRDAEYQQKLNAQPYQIFRAGEDNQWRPVLAQQCAPYPDQDDAKHWAIIDGKPVELSIIGNGSEPFPVGDDAGLRMHYLLMAGDITVGECYTEEY
ncbi:MAG: hypothetical protein CL840_15180 [Crocinitomicaceae bacterium]|nr:hypothetical protein [Crocinitomicaceae bacterium]|tara:strand:+ start:117044 stop:117373 length:330 start_codon:yes stop_codon:yes gene_type:complete